jgi:hypothetical protein
VKNIENTKIETKGSAVRIDQSSTVGWYGVDGAMQLIISSPHASRLQDVADSPSLLYQYFHTLCHLAFSEYSILAHL